MSGGASASGVNKRPREEGSNGDRGRKRFKAAGVEVLERNRLCNIIKVMQEYGGYVSEFGSGQVALGDLGHSDQNKQMMVSNNTTGLLLQPVPFQDLSKHTALMTSARSSDPGSWSFSFLLIDPRYPKDYWVCTVRMLNERKEGKTHTSMYMKELNNTFLTVDIENVNYLKLDRDYSPNDKKHIREIKSIIMYLVINSDKNCLLNYNENEYIFFNRFKYTIIS